CAFQDSNTDGKSQKRAWAARKDPTNKTTVMNTAFLRADLPVINGEGPGEKILRSDFYSDRADVRSRTIRGTQAAHVPADHHRPFSRSWIAVLSPKFSNLRNDIGGGR